MPRVILIDIHTQWEKINSLKGQMWERFQYSSPDGISDNEVNEVLLFGFQVRFGGFGCTNDAAIIFHSDF